MTYRQLEEFKSAMLGYQEADREVNRLREQLEAAMKHRKEISIQAGAIAGHAFGLAAGCVVVLPPVSWHRRSTPRVLIIQYIEVSHGGGDYVSLAANCMNVHRDGTPGTKHDYFYLSEANNEIQAIYPNLAAYQEYLKRKA